MIAQLPTESLVLAIIGSALGLFVAASTTTLARSYTKSLPRFEEISLDWRIILYTLGCAVVSTVLFALVPALQATRGSLARSLAGHTHFQVSSRNPLQWTLVGIQLTLAVVLLIGAALLVRSFQALGQVSPGFDASHILTLQISANWGETVDRKALTQRVNNDLNQIRHVPGVQGAATSMTFPGIAFQYPSELTLTGDHGNRQDRQRHQSRFRRLLRNHAHKPIISGQGCTDAVRSDSAVVNRSFVESFLHGGPAIGRHFQLPPESFGSSPAIIGISADARETASIMHRRRLCTGPRTLRLWRLTFSCERRANPQPWLPPSAGP